MVKVQKLWLVVVLSLFVTACASNHTEQQKQANVEVSDEYVENEYSDERDPLESFNRVMWDFNWNVLDKHILRPLAVGFLKMPEPAQDGVRNFVTNLEEPGYAINNLLQGKVTDSGVSVGRFVVNSTVGLLGIFDVAQHVGLERKKESFGETLGVAGVGNGPYVMVPGYGPTTVRDASGDFVDGQFFPLVLLTLPETLLKTGLKAIYSRADLMPQENMIEQSTDSYVFVKSAYFQSQEYKVHDGNPPLEDEDDEDFDEEFLDEID